MTTTAVLWAKPGVGDAPLMQAREALSMGGVDRRTSQKR